jgi:mxaJ protein
LRIGIQVTGDDYHNPPGAEALALRGITKDVHGYTVYGDYSEEAPQRRVVDAVAQREIDVAFVWGPLAGYFSRRDGVPVTVPAAVGRTGLDAATLTPFAFDIAMGVRRDDQALAAAVNAVIERRRLDIRKILNSYSVPLLDSRRVG